MRQMAKDDLVLFYHSGKAKELVCLAKVAKPAYPDPTAAEGDWSAFDLQAIKVLAQTISLKRIKPIPRSNPCISFAIPDFRRCPSTQKNSNACWTSPKQVFESFLRVRKNNSHRAWSTRCLHRHGSPQPGVRQTDYRLVPASRGTRATRPDRLVRPSARTYRRCLLR